MYVYMLTIYNKQLGIGFTGPTCCVSGSKCVAQAGNKYYSQCLPDSCTFKLLFFILYLYVYLLFLNDSFQQQQ